MWERVVIIGGNAAGMAAAGRAKRLDPNLQILVLEAGPFLSYSICGVPFFVSGSVLDHSALVRFTPAQLEAERGIRARTNARVDEIVPARRVLRCTDVVHDEAFEVSYDKLVIATGYLPNPLSSDDTDLRGVFTVSRLDHGIRVREYLRNEVCKRAVVVGGGYVGLMMATALQECGLQVVLCEKGRQVHPAVDEDIAELIVKQLCENGIEVLLQHAVRRTVGEGGVFRGVQIGREVLEADLGLIDVGIHPNTVLATRAEIPCGRSGGIEVDPSGLTTVPSIYAAGNCAETVHLVSGKPIFSALGTTAAKQGRVVGENLAGFRSVFRGSLETSIQKIFELGVSRTGLTLRQALAIGFDADSVLIRDRDRAGYYPGSAEVSVKLVFEKRNGRLLGGQIAGSVTAAKRIDTLVVALTAEMSLEDLSQLDLAYAPPFGTLWDPIQVAAHIGLRKLQR